MSADIVDRINMNLSMDLDGGGIKCIRNWQSTIGGTLRQTLAAFVLSFSPPLHRYSSSNVRARGHLAFDVQPPSSIQQSCSIALR